MTELKDIRATHREAMEYAQEAIIANQNGDTEKSMHLNYLAYKLEKQSAFMAAELKKEPDRSVLFRSAASLALNCRFFREAEKLVSLGLAGDPSDAIADELRDLYEEINFNRHLELKGEVLDNSEVQLSISGNEVSYGLAPSDEFNERVFAFEQLTIRSAERLTGKGYRTSGQPPKVLKEKFNTYLSVPGAASFAVKIRFGRPTGQTSLDIYDSFQDEILDEVLNGISLINEQKEEELKLKISDENYYQNFLSLTKALAPDGDRIKLVGITVNRKGVEKSVALTKKQSQLNFSKTEIGFSEQTLTERFQIIGNLRIANAIKNTIKIVPESGQSVNILVPSGLSDVVKLYWDDTVLVTVESQKGKRGKLLMVDIEKYN